MFENDIELLKKEIESLVYKYGLLETELVANNKDERIANTLLELLSDLEQGKSEFTRFSLIFLPSIMLVVTLIAFVVPLPFLSVLPITLILGVIIGGITVLYNLLDLAKIKQAYKELATDDNLSLLDNIDIIRARGLELNQQCEYLEQNISEYSELVGYLSDYENMISSLNAIKKQKEEDANILFTEYLNERIDYSKVHLDNYEMPEEVQLKKNIK